MRSCVKMDTMKPIVIITGAGASMPYGFPSGVQLREAILCHWRPPRPPSFIVKKHGFGVLSRYYDGHLSLTEAEGFDDFRLDLRRQELSSVDRFLEFKRNERFVDVGLIATAAVIGSCQFEAHHQLQLFSEARSYHWYRGFIDLIDGGDSFERASVKVITFNYDISLETYICQVLHSCWSKPFEKVRIGLEAAMPSLHVYGAVDEPWSEERFAEYHSDPHTWAAQASRNLKIIAQGRDDDEVFSKAKQWIDEAEAVFFYGFGYDETNMRRLNVLPGSDLLKNKPTFGTHVGLPSPPEHIKPVSNNADAFWECVKEHM